MSNSSHVHQPRKNLVAIRSNVWVDQFLALVRMEALPLVVVVHDTRGLLDYLVTRLERVATRETKDVTYLVLLIYLHSRLLELHRH